MDYTTVFFDWGGVIATYPGDDFLNDLLVRAGASAEQRREIAKTYMKCFMKGEFSEQEYWQLLRDSYSLHIDESISEEFQHWSGLKADNEMLGLVADLRANGIKTAVLSNVIEPTYHAIRQAGYYDAFDYVIASCMAGHAKPEPQIYHIALERTGSKARHSIFIDDKQKCLDPAKEMGFMTILAETPKQIIADVRGLLAATSHAEI